MNIELKIAIIRRFGCKSEPQSHCGLMKRSCRLVNGHSDPTSRSGSVSPLRSALLFESEAEGARVLNKKPTCTAARRKQLCQKELEDNPCTL
jgi:hypothetical protein